MKDLKVISCNVPSKGWRVHKTASILLAVPGDISQSGTSHCVITLDYCDFEKQFSFRLR